MGLKTPLVFRCFYPKHYWILDTWHPKYHWFLGFFTHTTSGFGLCMDKICPPEEKYFPKTCPFKK
jgi:hypothetical protein